MPPNGSTNLSPAVPAAAAPRSGSGSRNGAPTPPETVPWSCFLLLPRRNLLRQSLQLFWLQQLVVHHSHQQLLHGPITKSVDELLRRLNCNVAPCVDGAVNKSAPVDRMAHVAFLFEVAQNRANRRILERALAGDTFAARLGCAARMRPYVLHDQLLQGSEGLTAECVNYRSVITYNTRMPQCQSPAVSAFVW